MPRLPNTLSIVGGPGFGKTEFALRGALGFIRRGLHVMCLSNDQNTRNIAMKLKLVDNKGKSIVKEFHYYETLMPFLAFDDEEDIKAEASEKWQQFIERIKPVVKGEVKRTLVIIDNGTEAYRLAGLVAFGKEDQITPNQRTSQKGLINTSWRGVLDGLSDRRRYLIVVHRGERPWVEPAEGENKGHFASGLWEWRQAGFPDTRYHVHCEALLVFDENRKDATHDADKFGMKITRCQQRPGLIGKKFWGTKKIDGKTVRLASYAALMQMCYPDTTIEDWT